MTTAATRTKGNAHAPTPTCSATLWGAAFGVADVLCLCHILLVRLFWHLVIPLALAVVVFFHSWTERDVADLYGLDQLCRMFAVPVLLGGPLFFFYEAFYYSYVADVNEAISKGSSVDETTGDYKLGSSCCCLPWALALRFSSRRALKQVTLCCSVLFNVLYELLWDLYVVPDQRRLALFKPRDPVYPVTLYFWAPEVYLEERFYGPVSGEQAEANRKYWETWVLVLAVIRLAWGAGFGLWVLLLCVQCFSGNCGTSGQSTSTSTSSGTCLPVSLVLTTASSTSRSGTAAKLNKSTAPAKRLSEVIRENKARAAAAAIVEKRRKGNRAEDGGGSSSSSSDDDEEPDGDIENQAAKANLCGGRGGGTVDHDPKTLGEAQVESPGEAGSAMTHTENKQFSLVVEKATLLRTADEPSVGVGESATAGLASGSAGTNSYGATSTATSTAT